MAEILKTYKLTVYTDGEIRLTPMDDGESLPARSGRESGSAQATGRIRQIMAVVEDAQDRWTACKDEAARSGRVASELDFNSEVTRSITAVAQQFDVFQQTVTDKITRQLKYANKQQFVLALMDLLERRDDPRDEQSLWNKLDAVAKKPADRDYLLEHMKTVKAKFPED